MRRRMRSSTGSRTSGAVAACRPSASTGDRGRAAGWPRAFGLGIAAGAGWGSHLLLDYFGRDTHPPIGIPLLWPFSGGYFKSPWALFLDIGRTLDWHTVRHDALAVTWETLLMLPLLLAAWWWRWRRREG